MSPVIVDAPERSRQLRRMRLVAGGLLLGMFGLFLGARQWQGEFPRLGYLRAFAEAAMVGGFADWFAVAALFRHPFGIPIPHTAIIPRNKNRIGQSLGGFVANNFLSPDVLMPKVKAQDLAGRLGHWLRDPANARFVARRITAAGPPLVAAMQDEPVRRMLREVAVGRLRELAAAPLMARILTVLMAGGQHLALFDIGLAVARDFLINNQDAIHRKIIDKSRWWVPDWIDQRLAVEVIRGALETLDEMQDADHPWRLQFQDGVARLVARLAEAPETQARAETLKAEIIGHPEVQAYLESLWSETKRVILADLAGGERIERVLADGLSGFAGRLGEDPGLRDLVNSWINRAMLHVVVPNRLRIGGFMAGVVRNWDTATLVAKLELQVGRDLQYIRINGTLVGGMIGLLIHALS